LDGPFDARTNSIPPRKSIVSRGRLRSNPESECLTKSSFTHPELIIKACPLPRIERGSKHTRPGSTGPVLADPPKREECCDQSECDLRGQAREKTLHRDSRVDVHADPRVRRSRTYRSFVSIGGVCIDAEYWWAGDKHGATH
jgi:hypothetical protein